MNRVAVLGVLAWSAVLAAPELNLRGGRFKPLRYEEMTPEQRTLVDHVMGGERGSMNGPYNVLLRSPEMGDLAQKYGAYTRFHSSLSKKLNELAILIAARHWGQQYVWYAHRKYAKEAGLSDAAMDAIAAGRRPANLAADEEAIYRFTTELLEKKHVSDATFQAVKNQFGERGIVDLMGSVGYYQLVSMLLNVDGYPLPEGAKTEWKPFSR